MRERVSEKDRKQKKTIFRPLGRAKHLDTGTHIHDFGLMIQKFSSQCVHFARNYSWVLSKVLFQTNGPVDIFRLFTISEFFALKIEIQENFTKENEFRSLHRKICFHSSAFPFSSIFGRAFFRIFYFWYRTPFGSIRFARPGSDFFPGLRSYLQKWSVSKEKSFCFRNFLSSSAYSHWVQLPNRKFGGTLPFYRSKRSRNSPCLSIFSAGSHSLAGKYAISLLGMAMDLFLDPAGSQTIFYFV
ncbi:MAG: hypothetical protein J6A23_02935 [Thermoguttaceae bacterium]|nr:hypothetical protein [Thermoguttaceae bacterium]